MKNTSLSSCHCALNGNSFTGTVLQKLSPVAGRVGPGLNWLHGHNGQGKTNLVEAIAYLCNLESFRTRKRSNWYSQANAARMTALPEQQRVFRRVQIILSTRGRQVWLDHAPFSALRNMSSPFWL